jgi:hypothetical protein
MCYGRSVARNYDGLHWWKELCKAQFIGDQFRQRKYMWNEHELRLLYLIRLSVFIPGWLFSKFK